MEPAETHNKFFSCQVLTKTQSPWNEKVRKYQKILFSLKSSQTERLIL